MITSHNVPRKGYYYAAMIDGEYRVLTPGPGPDDYPDPEPDDEESDE